MITLLGHGYVGTAIASELRRQNINFAWHRHDEAWLPAGTAIINAAGYTGSPNVDACEQNKEQCIAGNVIWPLEVERRSCGLPVVHIGSGCVYSGSSADGKIDAEYTEKDAPTFTFENGSFYSGCKAMSQKVLAPHLNKKSYLLRARMPFGSDVHAKNLITKLEQYPKLVNHRNSMVCVDDLAEVAVHFACDLPPPGIYNVCNPGSIDTREIADMMHWSKAWFTLEEFERSIKAPRSHCVLDVSKLMAVHKLRPIHEVMERVTRRYREAKASARVAA